MKFGIRREAELRTESLGAAVRNRKNHTRPGSRTAVAGVLALGLFAACSASSGSGAGSTSSSAEEGSLFTTQAVTTKGGPGGNVVAELELEIPSSQEFVLRGTIPVPKGTYPRKDGKIPFSIRNWDGLVVPTQVEIVSLYPVDSDGADVIEVIGRVEVPPNAGTHGTVRYQIVEDVHKGNRLPIKPEVLKLVTKPGSVMVVAKDVFGHQYGVDVFEGVRNGTSKNTQIKRKGVGAVTFRTYDVMKPSTKSLGAPTGALSHLFGVHAYATAWRLSNSISLDLRINNGASGLDKSTSDDDPLGKAYFETIELWVPTGWTVQQDVEDPMFGQPYNSGTWTVFPIVKPIGNGTMHSMPAQAAMNRRLAITKIGNEAEGRSYLNEEGLGFNRRGTSPDTGEELYSWWNPKTARYFPQNHRLPELDYLGVSSIQGKIDNKFWTLHKHILNGTGTGTFPFNSNQLGWAHPYGVPYGGMTGGSEIYLYDGLLTAEAASNKGYRYRQLLHRNYTSRQPSHLYNLDGQPTNVEEWVIKGSQFSYIPMNFFLKLLKGNDPFGMSNTPGFQRQYVNSVDAVPAYESALLGHAPIDFQHYVRYTRSPKILAWLGNDPLAKDDLRMAAELFRLSYNEHYNGPGGSPIVSGLRADMEYVKNNPNNGFTFGRGEGWGLDVAIAAYATGDSAWRAQTRPWFQTVADTLTNGSGSCNGFIQATVAPKMLNKKFRARQSIEQAITENMLYGMLESVFRDADKTRFAQIEYVLEESLRAMISPLAWNAGMKGPHSIGAVGELNGTPYCTTLPAGAFGNGIDKFQVWSSFAYGYEMTGDATFLTRATEMSGSNGTLLNMQEGMGFSNLENRAALIADLQ